MRWLMVSAILASCGHGQRASEPVVANSAPPPAGSVALAIVFNGQEIWTGNDDFETDLAARMPGALHDLERGIDAMRLPSGSQITVIAYATGARIIVPWTRSDKVGGSLLGDQHAYRQQIGTDLVQGIAMALDTLERAPAERKALLVVGDGNDTNPSEAAHSLARQLQRATVAHVAMRAIIWRTLVSDPASSKQRSRRHRGRLQTRASWRRRSPRQLRPSPGDDITSVKRSSDRRRRARSL